MALYALMHCGNFNPRSREGSDFSLSNGCPIASYFNPRSREGSDEDQIVVPGLHEDFNPRSREGSDDKSIPITKFNFKFQSTLPRGERRHTINADCILIYFNPRSREGSDGYRPVPSLSCTDFNPRSREGSDYAFRMLLQRP